jgi:galactokinase/mevalonate kinase-like predicted kinase
MAIKNFNLDRFGRSLRDSFEAQVSLFPGMMTRDVRTTISRYAKTACGWKLSGAGGGGYLVLVSRAPIPGTIRLKIRRGIE